MGVRPGTAAGAGADRSPSVAVAGLGDPVADALDGVAQQVLVAGGREAPIPGGEHRAGEQRAPARANAGEMRGFGHASGVRIAVTLSE
jgi:hypothetical protein